MPPEELEDGLDVLLRLLALFVWVPVTVIEKLLAVLSYGLVDKVLTLETSLQVVWLLMAAMQAVTSLTRTVTELVPAVADGQLKVQEVPLPVIDEPEGPLYLPTAIVEVVGIPETLMETLKDEPAVTEKGPCEPLGPLKVTFKFEKFAVC